MKVSKNLHSAVLVSAALILFLILVSSTATADDVCGSGWKWSGGPSYCPRCCKDLGDNLVTCQQPLCSEKPTPKQLSPVNGAVFSHYPRTTTLKWSYPYKAKSYTVEIDCYHCCKANKWCTDVGKTWQVVPGIKTTSYTFNFVGAQPGRWRVWAVDANGYNSRISDWSYFRYTV